MPRGLVNLGNTCWFNSAIQALFHVPPLTQRLRDDPYTGACDVTREYSGVVNELLRPSDDTPVAPTALLAAFRRRFTAFDNRRQHDAAEALVLLLDVFEASLGKPFVHGVFQGHTTQTVTYLKPSSTSLCSVSTRHTPFVSFPLNVNEPGWTIDELLEEAAAPSLIQGYVDDDGTVHDIAYSATELSSMPPVCVFVFGSHESHFAVQLPLEWRERRLVAFVMHTGSDGGGHYVTGGRAKGAWWSKSDEDVEVVDASEVTGTVLNAAAYIGIYCKGGVRPP
jgi:hypothetical protein